MKREDEEILSVSFEQDDYEGDEMDRLEEDNEDLDDEEQPETEPEEEMYDVDDEEDEDAQPKYEQPDPLLLMQEMMKALKQPQTSKQEEPPAPPVDQEALRDRFYDDPVSATTDIVTRALLAIEQQKARVTQDILDTYANEVKAVGLDPKQVNQLALNNMVSRIMSGSSTPRECALELVKTHLADAATSKKTRKRTKAKKKAAAGTVGNGSLPPKEGKKKTKASKDDWHSKIFGAE